MTRSKRGMMGKAVIKLVAFLLLILGTAVAINWVLIPNNPDAYQAAKLDKLALLAATDSPKIVLVGGSNLAFSIDSEILAREFGMPVVNMGLAKSVGLEYLLEEARPYIGPDDIVILAFEYEMFFDLYYGSDGLVVELQYLPSGFRHFQSWGQYRTFAEKFGPIMQAKFAGFVRKGQAGLIDDVYRRDGFNRYGDLVTHLDADPSFERRTLFEGDADFHEESIEVLNEFYLDALNAGARVVLTVPPIVDVEYEANRRLIESLFVKLREELSLPVISRPSDYVFPVESMYDTAYHLLREGRRQRTLQLVRDLMRTGGIGLGGSSA